MEEQACDTLGDFAESRRNQLRFFANSISWWDRLGPEKTPITKTNQVSLHPTPKIAKKAAVEEILWVSRENTRSLAHSHGLEFLGLAEVEYKDEPKCSDIIDHSPPTQTLARSNSSILCRRSGVGLIANEQNLTKTIAQHQFNSICEGI